MGEAVVLVSPAVSAQPLGASRQVVEDRQRAARRTLRAQIARLESELGEGVLHSFERRGDPAGAARAARGGAAPGCPAPGSGPLGPAPLGGGHARLLDLGELERVRDGLAGRLREVALANEQLGEAQAAKRELLAQMLLQPGRHRFTRIPCRELGEPGCGVWHVRPRLGLIGMLAGWWQVKLSSGCPLRVLSDTLPARLSARV